MISSGMILTNILGPNDNPWGESRSQPTSIRDDMPNALKHGNMWNLVDLFDCYGPFRSSFGAVINLR